MTYFFHFIYERNDGKGMLWSTCFLKGRSEKEIHEKAQRCMSGFKNPKVVELRIEL